MQKVKIEIHRDDIAYLLQFFTENFIEEPLNNWGFVMFLHQKSLFKDRLEVLQVKFKQKKVITKVLTFTVTECFMLDMFCRAPHRNAVHDMYFQTLLRTLAAELDKQIKQVAV
jgi:hypothetical protein